MQNCEKRSNCSNNYNKMWRWLYLLFLFKPEIRPEDSSHNWEKQCNDRRRFPVNPTSCWILSGVFNQTSPYLKIESQQSTLAWDVFSAIQKIGWQNFADSREDAVLLFEMSYSSPLSISERVVSYCTGSFSCKTIITIPPFHLLLKISEQPV